VTDSGRTLADQYDQDQRDVLFLLTRTESGQPLWSVPDLARELDKAEIEDAVRGLRQAGLIHQTADGFVFVSRAGARAVAMIGHVI
jgi:hypothetical protein